jgi:peptidoglycan hydrolase CwlO-like protein
MRERKGASMPETVSTRVARLEYLMGRLAEKQEKLDDVLVLLTEAQIKTEERFQETDLRFQETEQRFQQTDERFEETGKLIRETGQHLRELDRQSRERDRVLDERVDKLVSAIGEMLRNGRAK